MHFPGELSITKSLCTLARFATEMQRDFHICGTCRQSNLCQFLFLISLDLHKMYGQTLMLISCHVIQFSFLIG